MDACGCAPLLHMYLEVRKGVDSGSRPPSQTALPVSMRNGKLPLSERSIGRTLRSIGWTRKTVRRIAQERDADLQDHYLHRISRYKSDQLVFINESSRDRKAGHRR